MHRTLIAILSAALVISLVLLVIVYQKYATQQRDLEARAAGGAGQTDLLLHAMLTKMPSIHIGAEHSMRLGETRRFRIKVLGLSAPDSVTTGPIVEISRDEKVVEVHRYGEANSGIRDSTLFSTTGQRTYIFEWKPAEAGVYRLWIKAGTNYMDFVEAQNSKLVKVGAARFTLAHLQALIDADPMLKGTPLESFIQRSQQLDPLVVTVQVTP
ncbi:MAG: hypothetical protein IPP94_14120 [Ignavibacteria bacterium]|nr:hypothetical protein [Ignavibacteria bacterium]